MCRKGVRQVASTASIPNTPREFFKRPAPDSTLPLACEIMPPTTGTAVEMTERVICSTSASAEVDAAPVSVRYPVNSTSEPVSAHVTTFLIPAAMRFNGSPGSMAPAAADAT